MAENICNNTKTDSAQCSGLIDVRSLLKARCEQRMSCIIELPDKDLDAMTPNCSKSAIPHLVIVYQCKIGEYCFCNCLICPIIFLNHLPIMSLRVNESKLN